MSRYCVKNKVLTVTESALPKLTKALVLKSAEFHPDVFQMCLCEFLCTMPCNLCYCGVDTHHRDSDTCGFNFLCHHVLILLYFTFFLVFLILKLCSSSFSFFLLRPLLIPPCLPSSGLWQCQDVA